MVWKKGRSHPHSTPHRTAPRQTTPHHTEESGGLQERSGVHTHTKPQLSVKGHTTHTLHRATLGPLHHMPQGRRDLDTLASGRIKTSHHGLEHFSRAPQRHVLGINLCAPCIWWRQCTCRWWIASHVNVIKVLVMTTWIPLERVIDARQEVEVSIIRLFWLTSTIFKSKGNPLNSYECSFGSMEPDESNYQMGHKATTGNT